MKLTKLTIIFFALLALTFNSNAQEQHVTIAKQNFVKSNNVISSEIVVDLSKIKIRTDLALVMTPILFSESKDEMYNLKSSAIYGHNRYYYYVRKNKEHMITGNEISYKSKKYPKIMTLRDSVNAQSWMNNAKLMLRLRTYGCCGEILWEKYMTLGSLKTPIYHPEYVYIVPKVEKVKSRTTSGSAFIDFVVNSIDIRPSYRQNKVELEKIYATIDSVKNDKDISVKHISIKGHASPEGDYNDNTYLARERTKALKDYINNIYHFPDNFMSTDYVAEDWKGFRDWVVRSNLKHKKEILNIIDYDERDYDAKHWLIKSKYPNDYKIILNECFPALRHSDYKIDYVVRQFTDEEEIKSIAKSAPCKLSLNELFIAASSEEQGSEAYRKILCTAATLYPQDETANLNAAQSCMQNGDLKNAEHYLQKAGESKEAIYARGIYFALNKDFDKALKFFEKSANQGLEKAANAIKQLNND